MNWRGTAPPTTLSTNSKPRAGRQRLDLDVADGVLPVPAGLLDVPAVARRPAGERLAQRHPQRHRLDLDAVAVAQPVEQHVDVRLAHAPQHELVGLGVVLQPQRRVLGDQPGEALGQLVLVGLGLARRSATGSSGSGISPRLHQQRLVLGREGVAGLGPGQLGDRADVAGDALRDGALRLAQRRGQRADPLVDVVVLVPAVGQAVAGDVHRSRPGAACRRRPGPGRSGRRTGRWWS